jgi:uncharacterized protein DUF4398
MRTIALIGAASVALGACASSPVPADRLAKSQAAIRSAQEVGADRIPPAALHLKVANEQLDLARKLMADGDNKRAEYVLMRAEADAETSVALAHETIARMDAQRTLDEVQRLKSSMTTPEEGGT